MKQQNTSAYTPMRYLLLCCIIPLFIGCSYYKPVRQSINSDADKMVLLEKEKARTLILHGSQANYMLEKKLIDTSLKQLSGTLATVAPEHRRYIEDKKMKYYLSGPQDKVLEEMHVYTKLDTSKIAGSPVTIAAREIFRMDLIQRDKQREKTAFWTIIGVSAAVIRFFAAMIGLATADGLFLSWY